MKYEHDRTWAEISLDNLDYNYRTLSDLVGPGCTVMAVIKGNFYGNGAITAARSLEEAGCRWMGLATIEEAMELRESRKCSHRRIRDIESGSFRNHTENPCRQNSPENIAADILNHKERSKEYPQNGNDYRSPCGIKCTACLKENRAIFVALLATTR